MNDAELKAKVEELEAVAEHVPPGLLARRLLSALEDAYPGELRTVGIVARIAEIGDGAYESGQREEIHERTRAALESAEKLAADRLQQISDLKDTLRQERIENGRPTVPEIFDPGLPQRAEDLAAHEIPDDEPGPVEEPAEDTKVCKRCGKEKPLNEFYRNAQYKDGYVSKCKACARAEQAERERKARERRPEPEAQPTPETQERRCANGPRCVAADPTDLVPTPAILDDANPADTCRRCQKRAGL